MDNIKIIVNSPRHLVDRINQTMWKTEGWSMVRGAIRCFQEGLDFFQLIIAVDQKTGEPIASISISMTNSVDHSPDGRLFFIGGFYVKPEYRGQAIGKRILDKAVSIAGETNVALNGVCHLTEFYARRGFTLCREFKNIIATVSTADIKMPTISFCRKYKIKNIENVDFEEIAEYDREISGRDRRNYLRKWLTEPRGVTKVAIKTGTRRVVGVGSIHPYKVPRLVVGPLYSDTEEIAEQLLHELLESVDLSAYTDVVFKSRETDNNLFGILERLVQKEVEFPVIGVTQFTKRIEPCDIGRVYCYMETGHSHV